MTPKPRKRARGNGEGSVRKRPDGRWEARYTAGVSPDGKQVRRSVYGSTRAECAEKLKAKLAETERGAVVLAEHGKLTLLDYARVHLQARQAEMSEGSYVKLSSYLVVLARYPEGQQPITALKTAHLERLYAQLAQRYAPSTVRQVAMFVNQVLRRAVRHELLISHPGLVAQVPAMKSKSRVHPLEPQELAQVLGAARETSWHALFATIASLGLRHGEALGLQWQDINWKDGSLEIRRTVISRNGTPQISQPKTKNSQRVLYFAPALQAVLEDHQAQLKTNGLPISPTSWVFPSTTGGMLSQHNVRRAWRTILTRAGVDITVRVHDLRHTFVSRLIETGADPKTAADIAGHADPRMTLSLYTHTRDEQRKRALMAASDALGDMVQRAEKGA